MFGRTKIGALFLAGDSWWESGICDALEGRYAGFVEKVEQDVATATSVLASVSDIVTSGLLHTTEQVIAEAGRFNDEKVDAVILCPIIWTNDQPIVAFLQEARKVPLMLWAYDPYARILDDYKIEVWLRSSGPVSVQQCSPILQRFGWPYEIVFGYHEEDQCINSLGAFIRAAGVRSSLRGTRIAMLPSPCRVVIGTWVDEFYLLEKFGVELIHVTVEEYLRFCEQVTDEEATKYVSWLHEHSIVINTPEDSLLKASKEALGMVRLAEHYRLSGIALEDFNEAFYKLSGARPHLYHPRLGELGCTVGLEADVSGILATIIAGRLAGRMGMFNELYTIDHHANHILMGHPGMGELSLGNPATFTVTPDLEIDESKERGVWLSYRAKAGVMTFLNMTPGAEKMKVTSFIGKALPGPRIMEGYSHMLIKPNSDVLLMFKRIVELGLVQHWGTVHGDIQKELIYLSRMMGLDLTIIEEKS